MANPTIPSMYQEVWDRLKTAPGHSVTLRVHNKLVNRVKQGVKKRKWMDIATKLINPNEELVIRFSVAEAPGHPDFRLLRIKVTRRFGLFDVHFAPNTEAAAEEKIDVWEGVI